MGATTVVSRPSRPTPRPALAAPTSRQAGTSVRAAVRPSAGTAFEPASQPVVPLPTGSAATAGVQTIGALRAGASAAHEQAAQGAARGDPIVRSPSAPSASSPPGAHATAARIRAEGGRGAPLEAPLRSDLERTFGTDLERIRVHTDRSASRISTRLGAHAFSVGSDIFFGRDRYRPDTAAGRRLVTHEVAHSVQGIAGRDETKVDRIANLRELLDDDDEADAIDLMRELSREESDLVLRDASMESLAVSAFDDDEMLSAVYALGGDAFYSLMWLFSEGNPWESHRALLSARTEPLGSLLDNSGLRAMYVDLLGDDEMAELVDILGGTLGRKLEWMQAEGASWSQLAVKIDAAPSVERLSVIDRRDIQAVFVDACDDDQMAEAADKLGGTVTQKFAWVRPEGSNFTILARWVDTAPLAERLGLYNSGEAAAAAVDACDDDEMKTLVDKIGGSAIGKVAWLRAEGVFDYIPDDGEMLPPPPPTLFDKPVVFGAERVHGAGSGRIFVSVAVPGHTRQQVSQYLYGTGDSAGLPQVDELLPAGTVIYPVEGKALTASAAADLDRALTSGTIIRGVEEAGGAESHTDDGRPLVYRFTAAGQAYELTATQMKGMLRGSARRMGIEADGIKMLSEGLRDVRNSHQDGTNSAVRWISDTLGDVDLPHANFANSAIGAAQRASDAFREALGAASIAGGQEALGRALADLQQAVRDNAIAEITWKAYIRGTIEGADAAVDVLSVVRDLSFAVAAGLAGAIVAPLAFGAIVAAGGGTLVAGGGALLAGAGAGATLKGGLEATGSIGGQLVSKAITPGEQDFDWSEVGTRTWSGVKSGAGEGALGAVSHFQGAYLATRFGPAFASTLRGRAAIGALAGGSTELALSTGREFVAPGEDGFSARNVLLRTAVGTVGGAATSVIKIDGLYRVRPSGAVSFVPWRGQPVTPEWMIASPWHYVQPRGTAATGSLTPRGSARYAAVNNLRPDELPVLPEGYSWARVNGSEWAIVRPPGKPDIQVHAWDGPPGGRPYFTVRQAEPGGQPSRMLYSEAVAGPTSRGQQGRNEPFPRPDYTDPNTGVQYRQGHGADHADTRATFGPTDATRDPANFSPQSEPYNDHLRNQIVQWVRANRNPVTGAPGGGAGPNPVYREVTYYGPNVQRTANPTPGTAGAGSGTAIPEGVYFVVADQNGVARFAWRVRTADAGSFASGAGSNAVNSQAFSIPINEVPLPVRWMTRFTWTGAGDVVDRPRESVSP